MLTRQCNKAAECADGFVVQLCLVYAIAAYWSDDRVDTCMFMDVVIRKALEIGMNRKEFAHENKDGDPVLAESWRRTWWPLYLSHSHFAAMYSLQ
jgi:hypothetical protein